MIVLVVSYRLGKRAMNVLLDKAPEESYDKVEEILKKFREIKRYDELRIRESGAETFINVKIFLDPNLSQIQAHLICDTIEEKIKKVITRSDVFVHAEPEKDNEV